MYTAQQLTQQLRAMGLKPTDAVMIHSSMKAIGEVQGRADTVLDVLMSYFEDGLLMLPTHTWATVNASHPVFDPRTEPSCVGLLTNLFLRRPSVIRSLHPTHSIAAYGKSAADFVRGEEKATTPCPPGGAWDRLRQINAKILLIGVTHVNNTFIHVVDEAFDVPGRLVQTPAAISVRMPDGSLLPRAYYAHEGHVSMMFDKLRQAYEELGAARNVRFGNAACILCDARGIFEVTSKVYRHDPLCFTSLETIPQEWWKD